MAHSLESFAFFFFAKRIAKWQWFFLRQCYTRSCVPLSHYAARLFLLFYFNDFQCSHVKPECHQGTKGTCIMQRFSRKGILKYCRYLFSYLSMRTVRLCMRRRRGWANIWLHPRLVPFHWIFCFNGLSYATLWRDVILNFSRRPHLLRLLNLEVCAHKQLSVFSNCFMRSYHLWISYQFMCYTFSFAPVAYLLQR